MTNRNGIVHHSRNNSAVFFVLFLKDIEPKGENTHAETALVCDTNAAKL